MKELVKELLELRIYGREVKLSRPSWGQVKKFKQLAKEVGEGNQEQNMAAFESLLCELGMPKDLLDEMDIKHVREVQDLLLEPEPSKKN
jgi:hypothetical protein